MPIRPPATRPSRALIRLAVALVCVLGLGFGAARARAAFVPDVETVAGHFGTGFGGDGGPATSADINTPQAVASAPGGGFYFADAGNCVIRYVNAAGIISTVAGVAPADGVWHCGYNGDGPGTSAELNYPDGITIDPQNPDILYIVDTQNFRIRELDLSTGQLSTVAGDGYVGSGSGGYAGDGGPATSAELGNSETVAVGPDGTIYDADFTCNCIRSFTPGGDIATLTSGISTPLGIAIDPTGSWLYVAAVTGNVIYKVSTATGAKTIIAGTGAAGYTGDGGPATGAELDDPHGLTLGPDGTVYFSDRGNCVIRAISPGGVISTFAGDGTCGLSGDGGPATAAEFDYVEALNMGAGGNLYITDTLNNQVREVFAGPTVAITSTQGGATLTSPATTVTYSEGAADDATACALDGEAVACGAGSAPLTGLTDGPHTFAVTVTSADGGTQTAEATFIVELPQPTTTTTPTTPTEPAAPTAPTAPAAGPPASGPAAPTVVTTAQPASGPAAPTVLAAGRLSVSARATRAGMQGTRVRYRLRAAARIPAGEHIVTWRWYEGRGQLLSRKPAATATLAAGRTYRLRLTVTDSAGQSASTSVTVKTPRAPKRR